VPEWRRRFWTAKVVAGDWKPVGSLTRLVSIGCSWRSFWGCGGSRIWLPPACTTGTARTLIDRISATKGSFGWDDCGCWISCGEQELREPCSAVYHSPGRVLSGDLLFASKPSWPVRPVCPKPAKVGGRAAALETGLTTDDSTLGAIPNPPGDGGTAHPQVCDWTSTPEAG
jgi:hypothetical protein